MSQGMDRVENYAGVSLLVWTGIRLIVAPSWSVCAGLLAVVLFLLGTKALVRRSEASALAQAQDNASAALKVAQEAKADAARARELATQAPRRGPSL